MDELVLHIIGTLYGDANLDLVVDGSDFSIWNTHKFSTGTGWATGDFNCDGATDGTDFSVWNANKFQTGSGSPRPPVAFATFLPQEAWREQQQSDWATKDRARRPSIFDS